MTETEWELFTDPRPVLESGLVTDKRKVRLFCVACCQRVSVHFFDERSRKAVRIAEQFADDLVSASTLAQANTAASDARSIQDGNFYTLDAGWHCSHQLPSARWCASVCAAAAGLGEVDTIGPTQVGTFDKGRERAELVAQCALLRDIFGNPFRPVAIDPAWRTETAIALARQMYDSRDFGAMPILADALQDAGCDNPAILDHCRDANQPHVRGCWVCDLVLGFS